MDHEQIAQEVGNLVAKYGPKAFREQCSEYCRLLRKQRVRARMRLRRLRKHLEAAQQDPRLADQAQGPPGEGWTWLVRRLPSPGDGHGLLRVECWCPPELAGDGDEIIPEELEPSYLPGYPICAKYAWLAVCHDLGCPAEYRILREEPAVQELLNRARLQPWSDGQIAQLGKFLQDVKGNLDERAWKGWLTVTDAARLLMEDLDLLDLKPVCARVSKAATAEKFRTNGKKGRDRRIEPHTFNAWRLIVLKRSEREMEQLRRSLPPASPEDDDLDDAW